jgi:prepilin-type processing-associated H-X9-DG protein
VIVGTAARSDYEAIGGAGIHSIAGPRPPYLSHVEFGAWGEPTYRYSGSTIIPVNYRRARFADVTDGLTQTMLVAERSARPDWYQDGTLYETWPYSGNRSFEHHQAAWAISTHFIWLVPYNVNGINHDNMSGIYSFHPSGAHCLFADGSVQFLSDSVDEQLLNAWATRSCGDLPVDEH